MQQEKKNGPPDQASAHSTENVDAVLATKKQATRGPGAPAPGSARRGGAPPESAPRLIVGIGASAGGLAALRELIGHLPLDHISLVVVQHLAPEHRSALTELLARSSKIDVLTARQGARVYANQIYVMPPAVEMTIVAGVLHLAARTGERVKHLPVDLFLRSLAGSHGPAAVGVVLSGTGSDGTEGLRAIKEAGGLTFVQDVGSAAYDGMPRSAQASGCADFCLPPAEIARELTRLGASRGRPGQPKQSLTSRHRLDALTQIFDLIGRAFDVDLNAYKMATLERRIERRMAICRAPDLAAYAALLRQDKAELRQIYDDVLINVTRFFRDPEAFEALQNKLLPDLIAARKPTEGALRVWVPGCATGEEAYALAMLLIECQDALPRRIRVQVFATDLSAKCIDVARRGLYIKNIVQDITLERLTRFFVSKDDGLQICSQIRDMIIFSQQNILRDAPFSRVDLVSCRNLLIYLNPEAQLRAMRVLHYALKPHGLLLLGASETVGDTPQLFDVVSRKYRIYARRPGQTTGAFEPRIGDAGALTDRPAATPPQAAPNLTALADRAILDVTASPGVVINSELEVLQFRGALGPFLTLAPGDASLNLLRLARAELRAELTLLLDRALAKHARATGQAAYRARNAHHTVGIDVLPLPTAQAELCYYVVLFAAQAPVAALASASRASPASKSRQLAQVTRELAVTRDDLQASIEEKANANEELKAANEELQSANEELQSTNEELETSKEEMQSSNEELTTVNEELQNRMGELGLICDDLGTIMGETRDAIIIVGIDLRIRRFSAAAAALLNLIATDVGRDLRALQKLLNTDDTLEQVANVIERLAVREGPVRASTGCWFHLRISPYKTSEHLIQGAVISLVDIDVACQVAQANRDMTALVAKFFAPVSSPLAMVDANMTLTWANAAFCALFALEAAAMGGVSVFALHGGRFTDENLGAMLRGAIATAASFRDYRRTYRLGAKDADARTVSVAGDRLPWPTKAPFLLMTVEHVRDVPALG